MSAKLIVDNRTLSLDAGTITIGRASENLVSLPADERLAPLHAVLSSVQGRWMIEARDGGPIRVGEGRPVQFAWLTSGDVIHLTENGPDLIFEAMTFAGQLPQARERTSGAIEQVEPQGPAAVPVMSRTPRSDSSATENHALRGPVKKEMAQPRRGRWIASPSAWIAGVVVLMIGVWALKPRSDRQAISSATPVQTASSAPQMPETVEPREFLVLVGIGDLRGDRRPHLLGVGWLWNEEVAVVPRTVGEALEELVTATAKDGSPRQACVIQGIPLEVAEVIEPPELQEISLLRLKDAAQLPIPAKAQWRQASYREIERLRGLGETVRYVSYAPLPRPPYVQGRHEFSLQAYDPELLQLREEPASLIAEQRRHTMKTAIATERLERGGLLVDRHQQILGMTLSDSSIVWSEDLERGLKSY